MDKNVSIQIPGLGQDRDVTIKDIYVNPGDFVKKGKSVARLNMGDELLDVFASVAGHVDEIRLSPGQSVIGNEIILTIDTTKAAPVISKSRLSSNHPSEKDTQAVRPSREKAVDLVVVGGGPGGYTAAFRAADLGLNVVLVDDRSELGGVCLNEGCIPSKVLLHVAKTIDEGVEARKFGVYFGPVKIDLQKVREWKDQVVGQLTSGLAKLAKSRKIAVKTGRATFIDSHTIRISGDQVDETLAFKTCIIATGSSPIRIPGFPKHPDIISSTDALKLETIPDRLLIIGGGVIGLEMATVYHSLGTLVTIVEAMPRLLPMVDEDILKAYLRFSKSRFQTILTNTKVTKLAPETDGILATFEGPDNTPPTKFDKVLEAVGRTPNTLNLNLEKAGVEMNEHGFIPVNNQQKTTQHHIYAIGDVTTGPMLAHKASQQGKVAAEAATGLKTAFEATVIPFVAYTDPEIAWIGVSETSARQQGIRIETAVFPWSANGRSLSLGRQEGKTKLIFDQQTRQIIGAGLIGPNASELLGEIALAIEMGADAQDLSLTIHPHPTVSETISQAAEIFEGIITDLYLPRKNPDSS